MDWLQIVVPAVVLVTLLLSIFLSIRARSRQRLIDDIPTSKVAGVFIGLVEVKGTAEAERPLTSYLASAKCVYYSYDIREHWRRTVTETYTDSKGRTRTRTRTESGWTTVDSSTQMTPFYLQDDTGLLLIRPAGAEIEPADVFGETCGPSDALYYGKGPQQSVANSTHRRRFVERAVPLHSSIYVLGQARERDDIVAPEIAEDKDSLMFLISTRPEQRIRSAHRTAFVLWFIAGLAAAAAGAWGTHYVFTRGEGRPLLFAAALVLGYLAFWFICWAWMVFNSIVDLKNRVDRAWSHIDVQLKWRHDLIPRLVQVVQAFKDYESKTHSEIAALRSQVDASGGASGPAKACKGVLLAIVERCPELKSHDLFLDLQKRLIETEQRIALARGYYNEIATQLNTRREIIPDKLFALLAGLKRRNLMEAAGFERAPVEVNLSELPTECSPSDC